LSGTTMEIGLLRKRVKELELTVAVCKSRPLEEITFKVKKCGTFWPPCVRG